MGRPAQVEPQFETLLTEDVTAFIGSVRTAFLATASLDGQPYVQHRGGAPGFLHVLDETTLAFADLRGNRQYLSLGNLAENPKVHLILMDYEHAQRVKVWGTAEVSEDPSLIARLTPRGQKCDQVIVVHVTKWAANCPAYIPRLVPA
jgi:uncharacterized protein